MDAHAWLETRGVRTSTAFVNLDIADLEASFGSADQPLPLPTHGVVRMVLKRAQEEVAARDDLMSRRGGSQPSLEGPSGVSAIELLAAPEAFQQGDQETAARILGEGGVYDQDKLISIAGNGEPNPRSLSETTIFTKMARSLKDWKDMPKEMAVQEEMLTKMAKGT